MRRYWLSIPALAAVTAAAVFLGQRGESAPSTAGAGAKVADLKPAVT